MQITTHLEHMESLKLYTSGLVLEQHHEHHEVLYLAHKAHHNLHVAAIQEQLPQQLFWRASTHKKDEVCVITCLCVDSDEWSISQQYTQQGDAAYKQGLMLNCYVG
jgi:hypothetical protein